jgi:hypothetical protein
MDNSEAKNLVMDGHGSQVMDGHGINDESWTMVEEPTFDLDELERIRHDQLKDLESGHGQSWTEGKRYNAQCDGKNHYLYVMDKSAINPKTGKGYSKGRIYAGTFENVRQSCSTYAANWQSKHRCSAGGDSAPDGLPQDDAGRGNEAISSHSIRGWQDLRVANDRDTGT